MDIVLSTASSNLIYQSVTRLSILSTHSIYGRNRWRLFILTLYLFGQFYVNQGSSFEKSSFRSSGLFSFNSFTPKFKKCILPTFSKEIVLLMYWVAVYHLSSEKAMKSQVLHTVECNISGGVAGEIWHWSLLWVKGLNTDGVVILPCAVGFRLSAKENAVTGVNHEISRANRAAVEQRSWFQLTSSSEERERSRDVQFLSFLPSSESMAKTISQRNPANFLRKERTRLSRKIYFSFHLPLLNPED